MIILYYIVITLTAFFLSLLDTSYFSFLEIGGATILVSYSALIILSLLGRKKSTLFFAALLTLFYSIFSSLPVLFLIFIFFLIPFLIQNFKKKVIIENNLLSVTLIFFVSNFIFEGVLILISKDFSITAINALASFTIINTLCGLAIYSCANMAAKYFGIKK